MMGVSLTQECRGTALTALTVVSPPKRSGTGGCQAFSQTRSQLIGNNLLGRGGIRFAQNETSHVTQDVEKVHKKGEETKPEESSTTRLVNLV